MGISLIFDYDGTIHDTMRIYEPALWRVFKWLEEEHEVRVPYPSRKRLASWIGMNKQEMWNAFLPGLFVELKDKAGAMVGSYMEQAVCSRRAAWHSGIRSVLDKLKDRGCRMAVLSNCQSSYAKVNWETFSMNRWFEDFYNCESFGYVPKTQIIRQIGKKIPGPYVIIGDRKNDMECARANDSPFIGCSYGFGMKGELVGADVMVEKPENLLEGILKML